MAYFNENTEKSLLLRDIRKLSVKLGVRVMFDSMENVTFSNLMAIHKDLWDQYEEMQFNTGQVN